MKLVTVLSTTALAILLGLSVPMYAQQDEAHPQEDKRAEPDGKAAQQQDRQDEKRADQDKQDKEDKQVDKNQEKESKHGEPDQNAARQDDRHEHQADAREGKQGGHIPDDRFRANFGRQHTFTIGHPVIVGGSPQFQYGGYTFVMVQAWPVGWAYTDVVYVDYIDGGYFLLSPVHPGVQIAINVIL